MLLFFMLNFVAKGCDHELPVGGGMSAMLEMLRDQFGTDVARLVQAKTDAASAAAEKKAKGAAGTAG